MDELLKGTNLQNSVNGKPVAPHVYHQNLSYFDVFDSFYSGLNFDHIPRDLYRHCLAMEVEYQDYLRMMSTILQHLFHETYYQISHS